MNLTGVITVECGSYNLAKVPQGEFWEVLARTKHVLYEWGRDEIWVCREPFSVSYPDGLAKLDNGSRDPELWLSCGGWSEWHEALKESFTGGLGMSSADLCLSLLRSGLELDITGTENYGPVDAGTFLQSLRGAV